MNIDILREIALHADYQTTINLLIAHPQLNTEDFWKWKCKELYPNKTYLPSFSGPENFLLKERTFILTTDEGNGIRISNCIIEYNPILKQYLQIVYNISDRYMRQIKINIEKQFIVLEYHYEDCDLFIFCQSDNEEECIDKIKSDVRQEEDEYSYYLFDANDLTLKCNKIGKIKCKSYDYYYDEG